MSRPPKAIRPVSKNLHVPQDLAVQVDLLLWSEVEAKVPHGAWARYIEGLIREDLAKRAAQGAARG